MLASLRTVTNATALKKLFTKHGLNKLHFAFDPKYISHFDPTTMAPQDLLHLFPDGLLRSECAWLFYILFSMGLSRELVNSSIRKYTHFPPDIRIPKLYPKLEEGSGGRPKRQATLRMSGSQCMHFAMHRCYYTKSIRKRNSIMGEYQLPKAYKKKRVESAAVARLDRYQRARAQWLAEHPAASRDETEAALIAIAKRCGA